MVELQPFGGGDELPAARDSEENPDVIPIHADSALSLRGRLWQVRRLRPVSTRSSHPPGDGASDAQDLSERRRKSVTFSIKSAVYASDFLGMTAFDGREFAGTNEGRRRKAASCISIPERNVFRPCPVFGAA